MRRTNALKMDQVLGTVPSVAIHLFCPYNGPFEVGTVLSQQMRKW